MRTVAATMILLMAPAPLLAEICIENATDSALYMTVETPSDRQAGWRAAGERLCASGSATGTVAAFTGPEVLEGCSRRVPDGATERLLAYIAVDACRWDRAP